MKLNVGSKNETKIKAVAGTALPYPDLFPDPEVTGIEVSVEEFGHPKNLGEIVEGAVSRAKSAYDHCVYSFGIESGLFAVPYAQSGFMELQACAIYDGEKVYLGFAPAFEWPTKVTELILKGEADGSAALRILGITDQEKVGAVQGGAMGVLTKGRLTREDQIKASIICALIQIEQGEFYT